MKLGARLLIFSSIFLLTLPALGYYFIDKIERSLLQGQEEAQSMMASAIATVVNGYTDLFDIEEDALYVYPKKRSIVVDGYIIEDEDWYRLNKKFTPYGDKFSMLLVEDERYLYAYLKVIDEGIVYRHPRYKFLDSSDHIRLEYMDAKGHRQRLVILAEGQGNISVYEVNDDWKTWKSGKHVNAVLGIWHETSSGYDVEIRLPSVWFEPVKREAFLRTY